MLTLKNVSKSSTRYLSSLFHHSTPPPPHLSTALALTTTHPNLTDSIKAWFNSSKDSVFDKIFEILSVENEEEKKSQLILSQLGTGLSERLVLDVLRYGNSTKKDVLSCLKFFDWAGRQHGFFHSNATFHAIFKILSRAKLMSLALDFLDGYMKEEYERDCSFYQTLVIGYAVSGKASFALNLLGNMRFHGHDLDSFGYHVLLNSLVEVGMFDAVQMIVGQIRRKGYECEVTRSILVKWFCRQGLWDEAELSLRSVAAENCAGRSAGYGLATLVDAHCKKKRFEKAGELIEEFNRLGVDTNPVYGIWLRQLVRGGMIDEALEFLKGKQSSEGYVPEVPQYNVLLCRLVREKKFSEAWLVLEDMKENQVRPDKVTMNAVFSLFCKAGMMDVALELVNFGPEFDYSWDSIAYNCLIRSLCEYKHTDEAFKVYKIFSEYGYFPDERTFHILASALCKKRKTDMVMELIDAAQKRDVAPNFSLYSKLIETLCRAGRLPRNDNLIPWDHNSLARGATNRNLYLKIIYWLAGLDNGDAAFDLLVEMQEKGIVPTRGSFRAVIRSLCSNGNVEGPLGKLLSFDCDETKPLTSSRIQIFNMFIRGAGHVKKPKLARAMFEMIKVNGLEPNLNSYILALLSYLKNGEVSDAMDFFDTLPREIKKKKLYNIMIVNLCKLYVIEQAQSCVELALAYFIEGRSNEIVPSWQCYEELVKVCCMRKEYDKVVHILEDIETVKDCVTTYVGNTLLFQLLTSDELYKRWIQSKAAQKKPFSKLLNLVLLMGEFSGCIPTNRRIEEWEEAFEKCFFPDVSTYNILLTKFSRRDMSDAWWLFHRLRVRGLEPNRWTYDILLYGLFQHGWADEAKKWLQELMEMGFEPTRRTKKLAWGSYHRRRRYA